jgi:hypothetical protein
MYASDLTIRNGSSFAADASWDQERSAAPVERSNHAQCDLLRGEDRLPMAIAAEGFSALEGRVQTYWRKRGVWQVWVTALREDLRGRAGRQPRPSVAIIDSQSVKTVSKGAAWIRRG